VASPDFPSLKPLEESSDAPRKVGTKAVSLARLRARGLALPTTWVLDAAPFRQLIEDHLPKDHSPRALLRLQKPLARAERAGRAREALLASPLPAALDEALGQLWEALAPAAPWGLAVRASPSCEDDSEAFMAGLTGSILGLRGGAQLGQAIKELWSLAFLPGALSYLGDRRMRDLTMGVLIQPVIAAGVSGVLTTRPPASALSSSWREGERLINACWGLGPVVSGGDAAVDVLRVTPEGEVVAAFLAAKTTRLVVRGDGVVSEPVEPENQGILCLSPAQLRALSALTARLEEEPSLPEPPEGKPGKPNKALAPVRAAHELTFAFVGDEPVVLQAQLALGRGYPEGGDEQTVWSRATVTESLAGVVSPLTWSLAAPHVEESFRRTFRRLGCSVPSDEPMLAGVHGRAYLNLSALMRMAVQLPGLDPRAVVQLSGVEGIELLERQVEGVSRRAFYSKLPLTAARQLAEQGAIGVLVEEMEAIAGDASRTLDDLDLAILPDDGLPPTLRDLRDLLGRSIATLTTTTTAYVTSHLALKMAIGRTFPVNADRLAQTVTAGVPTLEATRVAIALGQVAQVARDEAAALEILRTGALSLDDLPRGPTRASLTRFLQDHGHHAQQAAELLNPRWSEDPAPLLSMLAAIVKTSRDGGRILAEVRGRADRERALLERKMPLVERLMVRGLVERVRRLTDLRERSRGWFLRVTAMCRRAMLEVDRRLRRVNPSLAPDAVFSCSFDEIVVALGSGRPDVAHLVAARRFERARDLARPDPPTTFIGAPPAVLLPPAGESVLRGVSASGGVVTGRVRVLRDVQREAGQIEPGEILVVKSADLGLTPLFLIAGGLISQQGGRLTQGSVVARELGLPAVAHVSGATRVLRTGDRVRLDGDDGVVERLP
jgi:pyruvate,water dikinase